MPIGSLQSSGMIPINSSSSDGSSQLSTSSLASSQSNVHKTEQPSNHLGTNTATTSSSKGSMSNESQYMQQSNAICVFTTQLANQAAEAVSNRQFIDLIEFAKAQPGTREILEKNPLKVQQMNRNAGQWLSNFAQMKSNVKGMKGSNVNQMSCGMPMMPNAQCGPQYRPNLNNGPCVRPCNSNEPKGCPVTGPGPSPGIGDPMNPSCNQNWPMNPDMCSNPPWKSPQQQQAPTQSGLPQRPSFPNSPGISLNMRHPHSSTGPRACNANNSTMMSEMNLPNQMVYSNSKGPKAGDENLTPQQSQSREEKLAKLAELQLTLFGDQENLQGINMPPSSGPARIAGPNQPSIDGCNSGMLESPMYSSNCMMAENHGNNDPGGNMLNPSTNMNSNFGECHNFNPSNTPQVEWQKMQHSYMDENRRRKCPNQGSSHASPLSQCSSSLSSPNPNVAPSPGNKIPGAPPPYHQGHRPLSSPHPIGPNSSLSMQSPGDSSRQNSGGMRNASYASPEPATPGDNSSNISLTPAINSPKTGPPSSSTPTPGGGPSISKSNSGATPSSQITTSPTVKKMKLQMSGSQDSNDMNLSSNSNQLSNDCKSIHSISNCQSPDTCKSEPQLMPVPSPTQIEYSNSFEGQELTIQRQPNTSLRDADLISPPDLDSNFSNEYSSPHFPPNPIESAPRFISPENNINHRFRSTPSPCNPHYDMSNPRFMPPENVQRFNNPSFENRLPNPMDNSHHMRSNMVNCGPYGPRMESGRYPDNNINHRFRSTPSPCNPHYDMPNPRFMPPENVQRFNNPSFENRLPNPMDNSHHMRSNMVNCGPYGPRMESGRYPGPDYMPNRMRMPMDMGIRYNSPIGDNMSPYNQSLMHPISDQMSFNGGPHQGPNCINSENVSSPHLQNLQKMTPPFDIGPPVKMESMMNSGQMISAHPSGPGSNPPPSSSGPPIPQSVSGSGPMHGTSGNGQWRFDPIASMAAMSEQNQVNPMMSSGMNMSAMQVTPNSNGGPGGGQMVNFHTTMASMHNVSQNMTGPSGVGGPNGNGSNMNGTMPNQYGMNQGLGPNVVGGPQTVNNTYVNANLSIQQLNIQNGPSPNYSGNMPMPMNNGPGMNPMQSSHGSGPHNTGPHGQMNGPSNMQMIPHNSASPKLGMNTPPGPGMNVRMMNSGPPNCGPYHGSMGPGPRGMNPMNYPGNPNMGPGQRVPYNGGPSIQVKPGAPNTIQYLPTRPNGGNQSGANRPPNLDFLPRYASPLPNLDTKLPTHNLQYFPNS